MVNLDKIIILHGIIEYTNKEHGKGGVFTM